jgi:molecular chaperone DnaK (HSP70)
MPPLNIDFESSVFDTDASGQSTCDVYRNKKTAVRFSTISIREYNRIVGDHPDCKVGPPITIGWDYGEMAVQNVDEYESSRTRRKNLRLTSITRKNMLHNVFGISEEEIRMAEKEVQKILKQRSTSKQQTKVGDRTEAFVQSAKRKIRKVFFKESFWHGVVQSQKHMFPYIAQ